MCKLLLLLLRRDSRLTRHRRLGLLLMSKLSSKVCSFLGLLVLQEGRTGSSLHTIGKRSLHSLL